MQFILLNGGACDSCIQAIANDDYSGTSDSQESATKAGIARIGEHLIVGDDTGFSWRACCVCNGLAGNRHVVGYLTTKAVSQ